jgi:ribulose-phosphate 3-epimerase
MRKQVISASILNCDFARFGEEMKAAEEAGVDAFHMDIMDGHFVPNISIGPDIVGIARKQTSLPMDTHLMISNPDNFIEQFAEAGSDRICVHVENNANVHRTLQKIRDLGKGPGIVVNPGTPVEAIYEMLYLVEYVLILSVNPGFGGQKFIPEVLPKVRKLADKIEKESLDIDIQVDGGIAQKTLPLAREAGANIFVVGTGIFRYPKGIKAAVVELKNQSE